MRHLIEVNVPICPECSSLLRACYNEIEMYYRCPDCKKRFAIVDSGQSCKEVEVDDGNTSE